jgi:hypothetical protein
MATNTRTLIDFATGENWEMPLELYEIYEPDFSLKKQANHYNLTPIQYWMASLSEDEKNKIVKK